MNAATVPGPASRMGRSSAPVVGTPPGYDAVPLRFAPGQVVGPSELERALHRLAPAGDRVDARVVHREQRRQLLAVRLQGLRRELRPVDVRDGVRLLGHRAYDVAIAVADVDHDRPPAA